MSGIQRILDDNHFRADVFARLRDAYRRGELSAASNMLRADIAPLRDGDVAALPAGAAGEELARRGSAAIAAGQVAALVLNGGMATRFGSQVKSCTEVCDGKTFLDIKLLQLAQVARAHGTRLTLLLMNSFATDAATRAHLAAHPAPPEVEVRIFSQSAFPRLRPDGEPFACDRDDLCCYGPGHGDFLPALQRGELPRLLAEGVRVLQFSNLDNLGAVLDPAIIGWHLAQGAEMTVEVAAKRAGDKGGMPVRVDGKLRLVEGFAFPPEFDQDSVQVFNTATYVFSLAVLRQERDLPWYVVEKEVEGEKVIQFEQLAGDLSTALATRYLVVDRDARFHPVKTAADLEALRPRLRALLAASGGA